MHDVNDHIGEDAELYAFGELDEPRRLRLERHVASCDECARRVGDAEAAMLRLVESGRTPALPASMEGRSVTSPRAISPAWMAAVAAAFVLGLIPWFATTLVQRAPGDGDRTAQTAMLAGHFVHAPFVAIGANAPNAKVIYAREGGWIYAIVAPGTRPLQLAVRRGSTQETVATLAPSASTRSAFARIAGKIDAVTLLDDGVAVATARIVYVAPKER